MGFERCCRYVFYKGLEARRFEVQMCYGCGRDFGKFCRGFPFHCLAQEKIGLRIARCSHTQLRGLFKPVTSKPLDLFSRIVLVFTFNPFLIS